MIIYRYLDAWEDSGHRLYNPATINDPEFEECLNITDLSVLLADRILRGSR
jgi:hypothetical protein